MGVIMTSYFRRVYTRKEFLLTGYCNIMYNVSLWVWLQKLQVDESD